jgi:hypothetical protein
VDTIREEVLAMVRETLEHTLSEERVEAAVVTVATTLDSDCFVPFIDSNIAYAADTKVAAVASAVASYNQQVEDSLGQSLPVPGALLGPALSHADGAVVAVLASALETFLTPGDVEAATVEMQVRREKAFPSGCTRFVEGVIRTHIVCTAFVHTS